MTDFPDREHCPNCRGDGWVYEDDEAVPLGDGTRPLGAGVLCPVCMGGITFSGEAEREKLSARRLPTQGSRLVSISAPLTGGSLGIWIGPSQHILMLPGTPVPERYEHDIVYLGHVTLHMQDGSKQDRRTKVVVLPRVLGTAGGVVERRFGVLLERSINGQVLAAIEIHEGLEPTLESMADLRSGGR